MVQRALGGVAGEVSRPEDLLEMLGLPFVDNVEDQVEILIAAALIRAAWAQISTSGFTRFLSLGWPKWIVAALLAFGMALIILSRLVDIAGRYRGERA